MNYEPLLTHNGFSMDGALVVAGSHNPEFHNPTDSIQEYLSPCMILNTLPPTTSHIIEPPRNRPFSPFCCLFRHLGWP
jgi:hypothetical protein